MSDKQSYIGPPKIEWGATINHIVDPYFNEIRDLNEVIRDLQETIRDLNREIILLKMFKVEE